MLGMRTEAGEGRRWGLAARFMEAKPQRIIIGQSQISRRLSQRKSWREHVLDLTQETVSPGLLPPQAGKHLLEEERRSFRFEAPAAPTGDPDVLGWAAWWCVMAVGNRGVVK